MHYLEDYLEIIEFLPTELKSRFVQMKELDEHVQSQLESLNGRTKTFFTLCRKNKSEWREQQYQSLCQEYEKVMRDSAEKVRLSNQVHDLLDRHMRRLHQDLNKFTIELEADTAGITEILEQRSYLLDQPPTPEKPQTGQKRMRHTHYDDLTIGDLDDYSPSHSTRSSPVPPIRGYKYPRRERSSALNFMDLESDFLDLEDQLTSPSSFYTGTGGKPPLPFSLETKSSRKRSSVVQPSLVVTETLPEATDWMGYVDPNEPRYCLCNQVSYGEMVGCDNPECPIEWFHYGCVGITEPPKGKWYCPQCTLSIKRKGSRKTAS